MDVRQLLQERLHHIHGIRHTYVQYVVIQAHIVMEAGHSLIQVVQDVKKHVVDVDMYIKQAIVHSHTHMHHQHNVQKNVHLVVEQLEM